MTPTRKPDQAARRHETLRTATSVFSAVLLLGLLTPRPASAQQFFGGGVVAYDPEISVINSGSLVDAQVVVSHDRRYVTITLNPAAQSKLINLAVFPFESFRQVGGGPGGAPAGFVGGAGIIDEEGMSPADAVGSLKPLLRGAAAPAPRTPVQSSPTEILKTDPTAANSLLRREGMMKLERIR